MYIQYPDGEQTSDAIPRGLHCSNCKTEVEALIHTANTIKVCGDTHVVLLNDVLSVMMNRNKHFKALISCKKYCSGYQVIVEHKRQPNKQDATQYQEENITLEDMKKVAV